MRPLVSAATRFTRRIFTLALVTWFGVRAASALEPGAMQAMVVVSGEEGAGSAFLARMKNRTYVVTNAHVLVGMREPHFKTLDNQELRIGKWEIAAEGDIVRAEVFDKHVSALAVASNEEKTLKIGDPILVAGNSAGAGVVRELAGQVQGIGPDRLEISAAFVAGNSGSPVLSKATGEVLAVATYVWMPRFVPGSSSGAGDLTHEIRRFGYRLDSVSEWLPGRSEGGVLAEAKSLAELDEVEWLVYQVMAAGSDYIVNFGSGGFVKPARRAAVPALKKLADAIDDFVAQYKRATTPAQRKAPVEKLFSELRAALQPPDAKKGLPTLTGFYASSYKTHLELRSMMQTYLGVREKIAARDGWQIARLVYKPAATPVATPIPKAPQITLQDAPDESLPPDRRHRVIYPEEQKPANVDNVFWVTDAPGERTTRTPLTTNSMRLPTAVNGLYRVRIARIENGRATTLSNTLEVRASDVPTTSEVIEFAARPLPRSPDQKPATPDWSALVDGIKAGQYARSPMLGRYHPTGDITDLPPQGGVLIGFEVVVRPYQGSPMVVRGVRPIYLAATGQVQGTLWGSQEGAEQRPLVAAEGYAIGKVWARFDDRGLHGLKARFDRICGSQLDPQDSYESEWIGDTGNQQERAADTGGRLAVGVGGTAGRNLDSIFLYCLTASEGSSSR